MASQEYGLIDPEEENELVKRRLLNIEEKPFKRITKRLITPGALTNPNAKLPTPPPESGDGGASQETPVVASSAEYIAFKEDVAMDFAAFDMVIARLQFLTTSNAAERERYAADRVRILETMEAVRASNTALRTQLDEAKATLEQRKKFDELADKITSNRMLRTRAEQAINLKKLAEECEELQRESETYGATWRERKDQFDKLVDEGVNLRKLIRDEKEEVERREGMDDDNEEGTANDVEKDSQGGNATPARPGDEHATPRPSSSAGRTPRPDSPGPGTTSGNDGSKLNPEFSRAESLAPSAMAGTPRLASEAPGEGHTEDVDMAEETQATETQAADMSMVEEPTEETPQVAADAPEDGGDKMDTT